MSTNPGKMGKGGPGAKGSKVSRKSRASKRSADSGVKAHSSRGTDQPNGLGRVDPQLGSVFQSDFQLRIMEVLYREEMLQSELARRLGCKSNQVAHHFRRLQQLDCIEIAREITVLGKKRKVYRAKRGLDLPQSIWDTFGSSMKHRAMRAISKAAFSDLGVALKAHVFEQHPECRAAWIPAELDEKGWKQVVDAALRIQEEVVEIKEQSRDRLAKEGGTRIPVTFSLFAHLVPEDLDSAERREVLDAAANA